jgi:hypothetical protein
VLQKDYVQNPRQWSSSPLHQSRRRGIPSGLSLVNQHPSGRRELSVRTPIYVQKLRTVLGCIRSDVSATRPDAIKCLTSKMISFPNIDMGRQLQPSGRRGIPSGHYPWYGKMCKKVATVRTSVYTVRMLGQHHLDTAYRKSIQTRFSFSVAYK